jgi:hypothetical protein
MPKSPRNPKSGFATQDTTSANGSTIKTGGLVDPWGNEYLVSVDCDYDSYTQAFISSTDLTYIIVTRGSGTWPTVGASCFAESCFAESYGKDGQHGNKGDNKYNNSDDVISRE